MPRRKSKTREKTSGFRSMKNAAVLRGLQCPAAGEHAVEEGAFHRGEGGERRGEHRAANVELDAAVQSEIVAAFARRMLPILELLHSAARYMADNASLPRARASLIAVCFSLNSRSPRASSSDRWCLTRSSNSRLSRSTRSLHSFSAACFSCRSLVECRQHRHLLSLAPRTAT